MRKATNKNWQRVTAAAAALALCAGVLTGCGASSSTAAGSTAASSAAASEVSSEEADEMAAKNVADLIDAIYVQERNENTDAQCEAAKAAWDALTDAQKELVEGEEADPDYFGREQLEIWAGRAGVPIVKAGEGADPAAVIFDTVKSATARGYDMVIADTAGRLHNKSNLMSELSKISRSVRKAAPEASLETLLVLDAITGQNAISQAKEFCKAADATGIILTKLDGTAKGGCVVAVKQRLGLPVRFIGVGEGIDDLIPFTPEGFVEELIPRTGWKH